MKYNYNARSEAICSNNSVIKLCVPIYVHHHWILPILLNTCQNNWWEIVSCCLNLHSFVYKQGSASFKCLLDIHISLKCLIHIMCSLVFGLLMFFLLICLSSLEINPLSVLSVVSTAAWCQLAFDFVFIYFTTVFNFDADSFIFLAIVSAYVGCFKRPSFSRIV